MSARAVFLDRDGTLTVARHYPNRPEHLTVQEGVPSALRALRAQGWLLVVVTNQSGLARGYFTVVDLANMHRALRENLASAGVTLDGIYHCPHHPDGIVPELAIRCSCRKPEPGLLTTASTELDICLDRSWMVGDFASDIEAGRRAGTRTALVEPTRADACQPDIVAESTSTALRMISTSGTGESIVDL